MAHILYSYKHLKYGAILINKSPTFRMDHMPYGGERNSGNTREGVRYAIQEMSTSKLLILDQ